MKKASISEAKTNFYPQANLSFAYTPAQRFPTIVIPPGVFGPEEQTFEAAGSIYANVIAAFVPLANMFGYINTLRSMTSGRAQFTMEFDHYEPVPQNISEEIQKKYA